MKVSSKTFSVQQSGIGNRAPTKPDAFKKGKARKKDVEVKISNIPNDDFCITETRSSPCLASRYVESLKRIHKKLSYESIHCTTCSKSNVIIPFNARRNIICNIDLPSLCTFEKESNCPRATQVRSWLIKCRYLRYLMRKCKKHRCFVQNLKNLVKLKLDSYSMILR